MGAMERRVSIGALCVYSITTDIRNLRHASTMQETKPLVFTWRSSSTIICDRNHKPGVGSTTAGVQAYSDNLGGTP